MTNPRSYGNPPYAVALIHGGPGAAGEMQPVAAELQPEISTLEPLQTAATLDGQVDELAHLLQTHASTPLTLIGFSWGAWLVWITAAHHPGLARKLILIGSGPFDAKYTPQITENRLDRLSLSERAEYLTILEIISDEESTNKAQVFSRLGQLAGKADRYDAIEPPPKPPSGGNPFHAVLDEAITMRKNGKLLALAGRITCPVVAIHGEDDPHPFTGVDEPLRAHLDDFRMITLPQCGHKPWIERHAHQPFYEHLRREINND